jgi:hypothetical protein
MLVNLGSNTTIGAGASQTFQYACSSFQRVYVRCDDDAQDSLAGHLTVQIGNDVIANDISFTPLSLISLLDGGGASSTADAFFKVDFGSHVLEPLENLYVTIRNSSSTAMTAVDVSACVNEGGIYEPLKFTNYADKVFTDSNTLSIYGWAGSSIENDVSAFTIRNQAYSATPQVQSGVSVSLTMCQANHTAAKQISYIGKNQVPQDTSVNYDSTSLAGVVCVSAMPKTPTKSQSSAKAGQAVLSSMTSSERKAL